MRLVVSGGGTGGHIYPAIAVARRFLNQDPGAAILFVGSSSGPEKAAAAAAGLDFEGIELKGFAGKSPVEKVKALGLFSRGTRAARRIVRDFSPDCVLGTGGYASAPACVAAAWLRVPLVLIEMNVRPGIVTRTLARRAEAVAVAYPATAEELKKARVVVTGVPVRPEVEALADEAAREQAKLEARVIFRLEDGRKTLLVFGGSQGAKTVNDAIISKLRALEGRADLQVLHIAGSAGIEEAEKAASCMEGARLIYRPVRYIEKIYMAYAVSDLALCRSGASTIAELSAARLPAVLVPFPYATGAHQESNAEQAAAAGAAVVVRQTGGCAAGAVAAALDLLSDDENLRRMARAAGRLAGSGSKGVASLIEEIREGARGRGAR